MGVPAWHSKGNQTGEFHPTNSIMYFCHLLFLCFISYIGQVCSQAEHQHLVGNLTRGAERHQGHGAPGRICPGCMLDFCYTSKQVCLTRDMGPCNEWCILWSFKKGVCKNKEKLCINNGWLADPWACICKP